jgi:hypothetical protein
MANIAATLRHPTVGGQTRSGVMLYTWSAMTKATDDIGTAVEVPALADRSVQVLGTLGTGGSVRIEGSNQATPSADATDWHVLTDPQGNNLDVAALKTEAITEPVLWIRPRITAGDANTSLNVTILFRK